MTQQQIHDGLDAMLNNQKSRNFLNHLVRAYFPISNVDKVWDKPTGPFKCVLTKVDLVSVQEILEVSKTEEFKNEFLDNLKLVMSGKTPTVAPIEKFLGEKKLGFAGVNTTTFMSQEAVQEFYNWVLTNSLKGNKHINWLLNSIRRETIIENGGEVSDSKLESKVAKIKKEKSKVSTYTLGETDAFKKMREKFND